MNCLDSPGNRESERAFTLDQAWTVRGIDLTLIRWMLSLSPDQRLQVLENTIGSIQQLRRARKGS